MTELIISYRKYKNTPSLFDHFHAIFYRNGEIKYMFERSPINYGVKHCKIPGVYRIIHIVDDIALLIIRVI